MAEEEVAQMETTPEAVPEELAADTAAVVVLAITMQISALPMEESVENMAAVEVPGRGAQLLLLAVLMEALVVKERHLR